MDTAQSGMYGPSAEKTRCPSMNVCCTLVRASHGSPFIRMKSASLPASSVPTRSATPRMSAGLLVIVSNARSSGRPSRNPARLLRPQLLHHHGHGSGWRCVGGEGCTGSCSNPVRRCCTASASAADSNVVIRS